ncbi:MAG: BON domain-containing protein [Gammaproteobacteria bacterium]|nr:BON domain-containing protein [Gammaproteobacteria bacterium]
MIESKGRVKIKKAHSDLKNAHIDIVAYNGVVLLVGQVPSEETRQIAAETLQQMPKVKKLYNELQIAGPTSVFSRMNDGWLTTKIKSKMFASKEVEAGRIKVLTENGVTYLMGMVTKEEADSAVELARRVYGVQKVVKAFEIIELKDLPKMERASEKQPENNERNKQEEEELI